MPLRRDTEKTRAWLNAPRKPLAKVGRRGKRLAKETTPHNPEAPCEFPHSRAAAMLLARHITLGRKGKVRVPLCRGKVARHHMHSRGSRPDLITSDPNLIYLCWESHRYITDHPKFGRELGIVFRPWEPTVVVEGRFQRVGEVPA